MAKDNALAERFDKLHQDDTEFQTTVDSFLGLAPVFQALWLNNKGIEPWSIADDRREFVNRVFEKDPFIVSVKNDKENRFPAFSPACALEHLQLGEPIPADWPHLISMIYQVRCNLFHGGKNYNRKSDRKFIELACKILWDVWKDELPQSVFPNKIPWSRILIRSGFLANQEDDLHISLQDENEQNVDYLKSIVNLGHFGGINNRVFKPTESHVEEDRWLRAVESCHGGAEGGAADELPIMDTYMGGLVRWLNALGIETTFSCDGHRRNHARLECNDKNTARIAACILNLSGQKFQQQDRRILQSRNTPPTASLTAEVKDLLDVAEWLHTNQEQLVSTVQSLKSVPPFRNSRSDNDRTLNRTQNRRGRR
jgi:hypothetical protein